MLKMDTNNSRRIRLDSSIFFILLYKIVLDYSYVTFEHKYFAYEGFDYHFSIIEFVIGWIVYLIGYYALNNRDDSIDSLFLSTMFLLSVAPFISLYQFSESCPIWMIMIQIICLYYMKILMKIRFKGHSNVKFSSISYRNKALRLAATSVILLYLLLMVYKFGIPSLSSMGLSVISLTRENAQISTADSIMQSVMCRVICPLYILIAWKEKKWFYFALGLITQIYSYGITGFKTFLFIPIILFGMELVPKLNLKKAVLWGLPGALALADIMTALTRNLLPYALIGDRVLFFSAKIKYAYFDYFSKNEFVYFSQNSISKILGIKSNYSTYVPFMIGSKYFNKPNMWTNTGFIADAYSNGGILGVFLIATVLSIILIALKKRMNSISPAMNRRVQALFLIYFIMLHDGPFLATFVSGGMIVAFLIVMFVDFAEEQNYYTVQ